jgi:hypothetical protein
MLFVLSEVMDKEPPFSLMIAMGCFAGFLIVGCHLIQRWLSLLPLFFYGLVSYGNSVAFYVIQEGGWQHVIMQNLCFNLPAIAIMAMYWRYRISIQKRYHDWLDGQIKNERPS